MMMIMRHLFLSYLKAAWQASKDCLSLIIIYFIVLLICSSGDLTIYSPSYLWKNLIIFSCLAVAIKLNISVIKPWRLKDGYPTIPSSFIGYMILHGAYIPLMLLSSRQEMFPWFFPLVNLTVTSLFYLLPRQQIFFPQGKISSALAHSLILKENTYQVLKDKTILISTNCRELARQYAIWIAQGKPKEVIIQSWQECPLLTYHLHHDFPTISWVFCDKDSLPGERQYDIIIDGFLDLHTPLKGDPLTLHRVERLHALCDLKARMILTLIPMRTHDNQGNMIVEDFARRLDRGDQRVVPVRHYALIEDSMSFTQILNESPSVIKVHPVDHLVVRTLNLLAQLHANPGTSEGKAWALTEVIQLDLPKFHGKVPSCLPFQEKLAKAQKILQGQPLQIFIPDHLTATNEPFLAQVTQAPLSRKKLDGIMKKISEKSMPCPEKEAA